MATSKKDTNSTDLEHVINSDYVCMQSTSLTSAGDSISQLSGTIPVE
jgi:hypothetical protein